jgi:Glycosyltransferases involved in cell wall biogenesis
MIKASIITAVFNEVGLIEQCINSVLGQSYGNIEYIIVDGGSNDGTVDVIKKYVDKISNWISRSDNGLYYAMNKGLQMATGEIVGFLHSDDVYANNEIIKTVVSQMTEHNVDGCYGDLLYVDRHNIEKIVRYWKSSPYNHRLFKRGWMPPHPTLFLKRDVYTDMGCFNTDSDSCRL